MKHFFKAFLFETNLGSYLKVSFFLLLVITTTFRCTKADFLPDKNATANDIQNKFLKHDNPLSPSVNLVLNNVKMKMSDKQIAQFVGEAGLIVWDKAKAFHSPIFKNAALRQNAGDSIVVLPVALPNAHTINAALVARIYNNGDSIVYSTHFKNHFNSIKSTPLPNYKITAQELYVLGMAQLDAEVFGHKKFILNDKNLSFGQRVNLKEGSSTSASIAIAVQMCNIDFTYSSAFVFPPVVLWTYYAPCGSPKLSPPAFFLQDLDETYGLVSYSSIPEGGGNGGPTSPYSLEFSTFYQSLSSNQQAFLDNQEYYEYYYGFIDYLILNQFSQESQSHIAWCIDYLLSPTTLITDFSEFASTYLNDFPSLSFLSQDDINWLNNYPYLKSRVYYFLQNPSLNAEQKVQFHINKMRTESNYFTFNFAYSNYSQYKNLWFNDYSYLYSLGGITHGDWAINYLMQHPAVPIETFQNQFMGKSEGYEGEYDTYWDNPNLTFPPQNLPTWNDFDLAFPKDTDPLYDTPEKMYNSIGGEVENLYSGPSTNTCAIRLSKGLNYSGVIIPNIPGQTFKGADNKYYFKAAYQINIWMRKTFGTNPSTSTTPLNTNHHSYSQTDAGVKGVNLPGLLSGKKGIYSIYSSNFQWATGHADLLNDDATCGNNCHFADAPIYRLDIWTLN